MKMITSPIRCVLHTINGIGNNYLVCDFKCELNKGVMCQCVGAPFLVLG